MDRYNPIYYRYGSGGNVYYENNVVYVNGEQYGSADQYYNDTTQIAVSAPEMTDQQAAAMEWMPLGVFALTSEGVNASSMYLQLAVSKEGVIAGTFYNESTGATHPVEGMVDEKTQNVLLVRLDESERPAEEAAPATQGGLNLNLPGVNVQVGAGGVQVRAPGVNVDTGSGGTSVSAPAGVQVNTGAGGTQVTAPGVAVQR